MFFGVGYGCFCWQSTGGGAQVVPAKNRESFLLSKNVCWCWLRMLLLAEHVPATMLDPKALGTAFPKKNPNGIAHPHFEKSSNTRGRAVREHSPSAAYPHPPPPQKGGSNFTLRGELSRSTFLLQLTRIPFPPKQGG